METLDIKIKLDPVTDGVNFLPEEEPGMTGAMVIGTNGDYRIIDEDETEQLLERLSGNTYSEYMGRTPYLVIMNDKKLLRIADKCFFAGSALILKKTEDGIGPMSGDDFDRAKWEFAGRLGILVHDGKEFMAYEVY